MMIDITSIEHPDREAATGTDGEAATPPTEGMPELMTPDDEGAKSLAPWEEGPDSARAKKQAWTPSEDEVLLVLVARHGPVGWSAIANHLPGRIGKQCRERWYNHLSPDVKKEGFSGEEDRLIVEAVAELGTKWSLLVARLPGRTDNAIKNRWNATIRRLVRVQQRGGECPLGEGIDLNKMESQDLAKRMLDIGLQCIATAPRPPPSAAKRKIVLPAMGGAAGPSAPLQEPQGLGLLSHLSCSGSGASEAMASPRVVAAALSLGQLTSPLASPLLLPPAKRRRQQAKPFFAAAGAVAEADYADDDSEESPSKKKRLPLQPLALGLIAAAASTDGGATSPRTMHAAFSLLSALA